MSAKSEVELTSSIALIENRISRKSWREIQRWTHSYYDFFSLFDLDLDHRICTLSVYRLERFILVAVVGVLQDGEMWLRKPSTVCIFGKQTQLQKKC